MMTIRVAVAEDNYLVREGLSRLLEAEGDIELVAVCEDLPSLQRAVADHHPDVVVTDIRMPPTNRDEGLKIADELRTTSPQTSVVVLSQYAEPEYALALLERGAAGRAYLLKERVSDVSELVNAIKQVAAGRSVIDPKVVEVLMAARTKPRESPLNGLSGRELVVLSRIAEGMNNAAIASTLFVSERAVEKHINSIFSKLGLSDEPDTHRRVKAALTYLAETGTPSGPIR